MHDTHSYITLAEAARLTPGRPSTNCLWRWCRKGVLARNGRRVRLEHLRLGGKILTTAAWVEAFGRALAEADSAHFASPATEPAPRAVRPAPAPTTTRAPRRRRSHRTDDRRIAFERATRELEAAGL